MSDEHKKEHEFFVDGKKYETEKTNLNGLEIKAAANVPTDYQLFLEEEGDTPDREISNDETVQMEGRIKHFFAVPPATFG